MCEIRCWLAVHIARCLQNNAFLQSDNCLFILFDDYYVYLRLFPYASWRHKRFRQGCEHNCFPKIKVTEFVCFCVKKTKRKRHEMVKEMHLPVWTSTGLWIYPDSCKYFVKTIHLYFGLSFLMATVVRQNLFVKCLYLNKPFIDTNKFCLSQIHVSVDIISWFHVHSKKGWSRNDFDVKCKEGPSWIDSLGI